MVPKITLGDGRKIPQVGLGLWQVKDITEFNRAFEAGVAAGYRHFDSAQAYKNEHMLGAALKNSELKREDVWITTKIAVEHFGYNKAKETFAESLKKLQTDYVDLILLHFPVSILRKKSWTALEEVKASGQAKSIGVSNYTIRHLEEMEKYAEEMPAVNQVELHLFLQQPELLEYCQEHNIAVEAYSPLAHAKAMDEPLITEMAKKYKKSYAQIMLRWCVQSDLIVLPKSVTPSRIIENIDIFDFELGEPDMQKLAKLDRNLRTCWNPTHVP
ncbi:MAG TPA: aldo/keto reductase [Candidatus Saccharimonadales bacterium]|nr:aldo/keto reductase [Candidatus Saccharimonadales bacterium]